MLTSLLTAVVESSMVDRERHRALYSSLFPKYCELYDKEREMLSVVSFEMSSTFGTTPLSRLVEVTCALWEKLLNSLDVLGFCEIIIIIIIFFIII